MQILKKIGYAVVMFLPTLTLAFTYLGHTDELAGEIVTLLDKVLIVLFALALVYFFWGIIKFIGASGDAKAREEGKSIIIWGIIALAVMISVYGLINWIGSLVSLDNNGPYIPSISS